MNRVFPWMLLALGVVGVLQCTAFTYTSVASIAMLEERPPGTLIGDVSHVLGKKSSRYGGGGGGGGGEAGAKFALLPESASFRSYFDINATTGEIRTKQPFDRDKFAPNAEDCVIVLHAAYTGMDFETCDLQIIVEDVNDNTPTFPEPSIAIAMSEGSQPGKLLPLPLAVDPDSPKYSTQTYVLLDGGVMYPPPFVLREMRAGSRVDVLALELVHPVDRERQGGSLIVHVLAMDGGMPVRTGTLTVEVNVVDVNDNEPRFSTDLYEITVSEDAAPGTIVGRLLAADADDADNGRVRYELSPGAGALGVADVTFAVHNTTGDVFLLQRLHWHIRHTYSFFVDVYDLSSEPLSSRAKVLVNVIDVNDHAPRITLTPRYDDLDSWAALSEGQQESDAGHGQQKPVIALAYVVDLDHGANKMVNCYLNSDIFLLDRIDDEYYRVLGTQAFDREQAENLTIVITCSDKGRPPLTSTATLNIRVRDVNDHAPVFDTDLYVVTALENTINASIIAVHASDADSGVNAIVKYRLADEQQPISEHFAIDADSGLVSIVKALDYEKLRTAHLAVVAYDGGTPSLSSSSRVIVHVINANDEPPTFSQSHYVFHVSEGLHLGTVIGKVFPLDRDEHPFNKWKLVAHFGGDRRFALSVLGVLSISGVLDREAYSAYNFTVTATDTLQPHWNASALVTVLVDDVNDNAPMFVFPLHNNTFIDIPCDVSMSDVVTTLSATDADVGANGDLVYSLFPLGSGSKGVAIFTVHPSTGQVMPVKDLTSLAGQTFRILASVSDRGQPSLSASVTLYVTLSQGGSTLSRSSTMTSSSASSATWLTSVLRVFMENQDITFVIIIAVVVVCIMIVCVVLIFALSNKKKRRKRGAPCDPSNTTAGYGPVACCDSDLKNGDLVCMQHRNGVTHHDRNGNIPSHSQCQLHAAASPNATLSRDTLECRHWASDGTATMSASSVPDFGMTTSCVSLPCEGRYRVTGTGNGADGGGGGCECEQEHLLTASRTVEQLSPTRQLSLSRRICLHDNGGSRCFNGARSVQSITRDCSEERLSPMKPPDLLSNGGGGVGANGCVHNSNDTKRPSELGDLVYIRTKLLDGLNYNGSAHGGGDCASTLRSFRSASPYCSPDDVIEAGTETGNGGGAECSVRELSESGFRYNNGAVWNSTLTSASGIRSTTPSMLPRSLTSPPGTANGGNGSIGSMGGINGGRGLMSPLDYRLNSLMLPAALRESNI